MSVIAARITKEGYEIASDSISVRGYTQCKSDRGNFAKMAEVNGIVIASVGGAEESALLMLFSETRKPAAATELGMLNFLGEFSEWKNKKIAKIMGGNNYIIGFENKVFHICGWQIDEVRTFEADGAGMDFALAALHLGHSVEQAIETAIELSIYCEGPVKVIKKRVGL